MSDLPFTFCWVTEDQTTFDASTMNVFDEDIFSLSMKHDEGQIPTLNITIRNPRVGLLAPTRKLWAWLAWQSPTDDPDYAGALVPIFFGVVIGVPTNLFAEKVTLQLIARSPQFISNKQAVAETMKVQPYFDPIWFDENHRDDPDSILEGWSSFWHIDRTSLAITQSDVLVGEDGNVVFDESVALYDSVGLTLGQPPLTNLRVVAKVNWTQRTAGYFEVPAVNISSYTGESLISGWPQPGAGIGGGYTVEQSYVNDVYDVSQTPMTSYQSSWTNPDPDPGQCGNASASSSSSGPALLSPNPLTAILTGQYTTGLCFPTADPPQNLPAHTSTTGVIVPLWNVSMSMTVRYDAQRQFSEVLVFDMLANTQGILASPTVSQDTEVLSISSVDIGKPLVEVKAWTDFRGQAVSLAEIIFPNDPTTPGGLSHQICVVAGVAGAVEPQFSDFAGSITVDGSVQWASMGEQPLSDSPGWSPGSYVPLGQIILLQQSQFNPNLGQVEFTPNTGSYYLCTTAGQTNGRYDTFTYVPPVHSNTVGTPNERTISIIDPPSYVTSPGSHVSDGSVVWTVLGTNPPTLQIPIGGTPTDVKANNFFPTERGRQSIEFLISKARARLRIRARAVTLTWGAAFREGVGLSCRKNATLHDPRLPGGIGTGKITSYTLSASGAGVLRMQVEVGCSVGFDDTVIAELGTPVYAAAGYAAPGYQRYEGSTSIPDSNDTSYTMPAAAPFDDGLRFPLSWAQVSDGGRISGSLADQKAAIEGGFAVARELQYIQAWAGGSINPFGQQTQTQSGLSSEQAWSVEREQLALASQSLPYVMAANPIVWTALIKPCAGNGPFEGAYAITVSPLVLPQGIDLLAHSSV